MPEAPLVYSRELELVGGLNAHGKPNYILWWTSQPRREYGGSEYLLDYHSACWALAEWKEAEEFGSPRFWAYDQLGPFPHHGRYVMVQPFFDWDTLAPVSLDSFFLNPQRLRHMVKVYVDVLHQRLVERKRRQREIKESEDKEERRKIADLLQDSLPAFGEAASYSLQVSTKTALKQRMEQIEKNLPHSNRFKKKMRKGPKVL